MHGRPFPVGLCSLSLCLHDVSALPVICALHRTALHPPATRYPLLPIGATGAHLTARQRPCPNAQPIQPDMNSFSGYPDRSLCSFPRVGRLEGHGITVLLVQGAAAPVRAVAHNSHLCLSEYGRAVLLMLMIVAICREIVDCSKMTSAS
jgi:hypothetical protein